MSQSEQELPESQEDSLASPEGEEPKANPFIPNAKAYWCPSCKAHYDYGTSTHHTSSGTTSTTTRYICKVCGANMFWPGETVPWMYGLNGIGILCLVIGLGIGWSRGGFDFEDGNQLAPLLFAAFCLLIGGMMTHYMRKWVAWSSTQKKKSAKELEREAMNAPSAAEGDTAEKTEP